MAQPKLTPAQRKTMKWIGYGWEAQPGAGSTLMANGKVIGNMATMKALERMGYAEVDSQKCWKATAAGRSVTGQLCI